MKNLKSLLEEIQSLSAQAARFRRVILHLHSPESYDFATTPDSDPELNKKELYFDKDGEKLFLSHLDGSVDLIAITDHMKSGYALRVSESSIKNKHSVRVLPGIELNIRLQPPLHTLRLHLLIIFPENKSIGEIERIFPHGKIPDDSKRTGQEEISIDNLPEFINDIRKNHNGLCIAAHVDKNNGIRMLFRQTGHETISLFNPDGKLAKEDETQISESFKGFLAKMQFDGIEITKAGDRNHYTWKTEPETGVTFYVPVFLTFDAHNIETLKALSNTKKNRITYVKMADISWNGLRDAIRFPNTRIRFSDDRVPPPYIVGLQIVSGNGEGFFPELRLGFVENLNCIIGARGSGKSTVIDAIRYVFGYNRTLDELGSLDLKKAVLDRQKATLISSIIRVYYQVNETDIHVLEATYGGEKADYVTKVFDINGDHIHVDDVEKSDRYPLRLFGWSEIETLGRDSERQMDLLDKLVEGIRSLNENKAATISTIRENTHLVLAQAEKLIDIYHTNNDEIRRYKEYRQEFEKYNTPEVEQLFKDLDLHNEQKDFLDTLLQSLNNFQGNITEITPHEFENIIQEEFTENPILKKWWDTVKDKKLQLSSLQKTISDSLKSISDELEKTNKSTKDFNQELGNEIEKLNEKIRKEVSVDPKQQVLADLRAQTKERLDYVEGLREDYAKNYQELMELLERRKSHLSELLKIHEAITQLRLEKNNDIEQKLNEFQTEEMKIKIRLTKDGNKNKFEDILRDLTSLKDVHRNFKAKKWPEILSSAMTPLQFTENILQHKNLGVVLSKSIEGTEYSIIPEEYETILNTLVPFKEDTTANVIEIDLDKLKSLLQIEEIEWDDKVNILRNEQPIENASPGQRSSAMLPLIALAEKVPLIIDQPEDNLDNRLVGKVLVDILAKLKEKRQIIVCTHNPNIVVLGDAEQVIVLNAVNNAHGDVEGVQASIDHPDIVNKVIELMEGGKDAFDTRKKRYGI